MLIVPMWPWHFR